MWVATAMWALAPVARATPSEAAALGGLDLAYPDEVDTFQYFDTDLMVFVNPALALRYRNQVQVNLGFSPGVGFEGMGVHPRGLALVGGDGWALGLALNRSPGELGENAAIDAVLERLTEGPPVPGELGGVFVDPVAAAGVGTPREVVPLAAPVDLIGAVGLSDSATLGFGVYAAFGQARSDLQTAVADPADDWARTRTLARSSWLTARVGLAVQGDAFSPEVWLRYTGVSSWSDRQSFGPAPRDKWGKDDITVDETVGLNGLGRIGVGARAQIAVDDTWSLLPALAVDGAAGRTFAEYRLANDPDESAAARAEDDLVRASAWLVRVGTGVQALPAENLRVVATASAQLEVATTAYDNNAQIANFDGETRSAVTTRESAWLAPLVSLAGEYRVSPSFAMRAAVRQTVWLDQDRTVQVAAGGTGDDPFAIKESSRAVIVNDSADLPPLTVALGPSVSFDALTVDAVVGGGMMGAGNDLFSRIDAVFFW